MKKFEVIESPQNAKFKTWYNLKTTKGIKKTGKAIVAGKALVSELHRHFYDEPLEILFTETMGLPVNLGPQSKAYQLSEKLFSELDPLGLHFPILIVPIPEIPKVTLNEPPKGVQVLLPLGDPKNLGAAIRNCLAFGIQDVVLLQEAAHPFHHASIKASSGAVFKVNLKSGPSVLDLKPSESLFCLDGGGQNLIEFKWPKSLSLLVGEEGPGIPEHLRDHKQTLSIPIVSHLESLNAHQALGIALYDLCSKQHKS